MLWIVVYVVKGTFRTIPTVESYGVLRGFSTITGLSWWEFFVPARTLIAVKLLRSLVVVGLRRGEYSAKLVFELVNGLRCDHAIEACQFVAEGDECIVRAVRC